VGLRRRADAAPRRIRPRRTRLPVRVVAVLLLTAVAVGVWTSDRRADAAVQTAAAVAEIELLPLLDELDAVWSAERGDGPTPALLQLRAEGRRPSGEDVATWEAAHAALLLRVVGLDLPVGALGAQRQAVLAVTLSRDAVAVMSRAATARDAAVRDALADEAVRLRGRSEQIAASSLAALEELRSGRRRITAPAPVLVPRPEP
jgi:hypothetical protein